MYIVYSNSASANLSIVAIMCRMLSSLSVFCVLLFGNIITFLFAREAIVHARHDRTITKIAISHRACEFREDCGVRKEIICVERKCEKSRSYCHYYYYSPNQYVYLSVKIVFYISAEFLGLNVDEFK